MDLKAKKKRPTARVLVADDEERIRIVLVRILTDAGYHADSVGRGDEALRELVRGDYEIAILDAQMPVFGAIEIAAQYQVSAAHPIPIIVLTADASSATVAKCASVGIHKVLTKPVRSQGLLDAINQMIISIDRAVVESTTDLLPKRIIAEQIMSDLAKLYPEPEVLKDMLRQFVIRMKEIAKEIETALGKRKLTEVYRLLHRLEGVAGSMGALVVQNDCRELREVKNQEKTDALVKKLSSAINEVAHALKRNYDISA